MIRSPVNKTVLKINNKYYWNMRWNQDMKNGTSKDQDKDK